jgi:hypothetical protein
MVSQSLEQEVCGEDEGHQGHVITEILSMHMVTRTQHRQTVMKSFMNLN